MTAMITKTRALALVLAACFGASTLPVAFASAAVTAPQDDEEKPDKRPEIKEALAAFQKHVSKRGDEDVEAIAIIDQMLQEFPSRGRRTARRSPRRSGRSSSSSASRRRRTSSTTSSSTPRRSRSVAWGRRA